MNLYYESSNELYHHGIKGMKWGRRRFQNSDGSLTAAGRKRYVTVAESQRNASRAAEKARKESISKDKAAGVSGVGSFRKVNRNALNAKRKAYGESVKADREYNKQLREERKAERNTPEAKAERRKKALKVGAAVAGTALAAYGVYKINQYVKTKNCEIAADRGREAATKIFEKEQMRAFNDMKSDSSLITRSVEINVNAKGKEAADRASRDSFGKAAKNVLDYKRSGGDLRNLPDLSNYDEDKWFKVKFARK